MDGCITKDPSEPSWWSIVLRVLFQQTNKQTNKETNKETNILMCVFYFYFVCLQIYTRQNGRKMTLFRGAMAKLGAGVDNELGGSAPQQCR